jgi:hypothetical protein
MGASLAAEVEDIGKFVAETSERIGIQKRDSTAFLMRQVFCPVFLLSMFYDMLQRC